MANPHLLHYPRGLWMPYNFLGPSGHLVTDLESEAASTKEILFSPKQVCHRKIKEVRIKGVDSYSIADWYILYNGLHGCL